MNAIVIGPLALAPDRFAAILAIAAFLISGALLSRRVDRRFADWAWWAVVIFVVGARVGHVASHTGSFLAEPWRVFAIWQGGFSIWTGAVLATLYLLFALRGSPRLMPWLLAPATAAIFAGFLVLGLTGTPEPRPLPDAVLYRLAGQAVDLRIFRGTPLVVNLWATWCPPCWREMPMMADISASSPDMRFAFVNQRESKGQVDAYLEREGLALPNVLLDSLGAVARHYNAFGLPTTLFIGADGLLQQVHFGEISRELLLEKMESLQRRTPVED